jgi:hypothetical protein
MNHSVVAEDSDAAFFGGLFACVEKLMGCHGNPANKCDNPARI